MSAVKPERSYPIELRVPPDLDSRNRLTTAFRPILALPHLLLVGVPIALALLGDWGWGAGGNGAQWSSGGLLGAVAALVALIAWFAILFTGSHPEGLWNLAAFYLRWRARAMAYIALLRDEYPPFGDGRYPVVLSIEPPKLPRNRVTVAFRIFLALPHLLVLVVLGLFWTLTSIVAWFAILFSGRYPAALYRFAVGVLRWSTRVEGYLLLLTDEYPPFALS